MYFTLFLTFLTCQMYYLVPSASANPDVSNSKELCPFENTVNLTNRQIKENGSYLYQDILIPPEKQKLYDYVLKFERKNVPAPTHLRGCACEAKPCVKLCCNEDEYFNDDVNITKCEKLTPDMKISWDVSIYLGNGMSTVVNIFKHFTTQVGLPCPVPEVLFEEIDYYKLQENGILYIGVTDTKLNTIDYCYSPYLNEDTMDYILKPYNCAIPNTGDWRLLLNTYAMTASVAFLIPTIVVYLLLKELRGTLHGKLLICYLISLTMGYSIISFINISKLEFNEIECSFLGFSCYFFFMAAFLWLGVLCYDIWRNFDEKNPELKCRNNYKQFIFYSLYTWVNAGLATAMLLAIQLSDDVDEIYKPGIGTEMCWLDTEKWSAGMYFYGPNLIILLFNLSIFSILTLKIYTVRRSLAKMTRKEKFFQENAVIILRLFLIMGISWLFDILSYCLRAYKVWSFLFILSDFGNAIQGILIFSLFVLKPNVWNLLKKKFRKQEIGKPRRSISTSTTNFSKVPLSVTETNVTICKPI